MRAPPTLPYTASVIAPRLPPSVTAWTRTVNDRGPPGASVTCCDAVAKGLRSTSSRLCRSRSTRRGGAAAVAASRAGFSRRTTTMTWLRVRTCSRWRASSSVWARAMSPRPLAVMPERAGRAWEWGRSRESVQGRPGEVREGQGRSVEIKEIRGDQGSSPRTSAHLAHHFATRVPATIRPRQGGSARIRPYGFDHLCIIA